MLRSAGLFRGTIVCVTVDPGWANSLTREARGLIASAMLQSVAHRSQATARDVWTSVESRERHQTREAENSDGTCEADEANEPDDGASCRTGGGVHDIGAALAATARVGGAMRRTMRARPVGTGNPALDDAIADAPDRLPPGDRSDEAPVIRIFSSDPMIQRIGLRELFNREARLLFIAPGAEPLVAPRFYRWHQAVTDDADDRPSPALPHCARPLGIDTAVWQALAREGLLIARCRAWLGGYFTAINVESVAADAARRHTESRILRLRLVGHGTTIDADGRHPIRVFAGIAAPTLADYLIARVLPICALLDARCPVIWIDFVACALAVPGECATSRRSYIGTFLRALHALSKGCPLMDRIRVSASTHVLMFQPGNFKKRREVVVAGLTLTPTRAQLREFGLASTVTVHWQRGAPIHCDANAPTLDARARRLLQAYAAAWGDWDKKGRRWRKNDVPSRFVLFDTLLDTTVRLEDQDDIAVIQTFIDRVSPGAWGPVGDAPSAAPGQRRRTGLFARSASPLPRSVALPIRPRIRKVSLDHGQWRAHYDAAPAEGGMPDPTSVPTARFWRGRHRGNIPESPEGAMAGGRKEAVAGSLEECAVSLALALQKIMTSRAYLARLSKTQQKALRRYYMTPWRMVDEAVFRRIGLPTTAVAFVARWKGLASGTRSVRLGGEVLQGLLTLGMPHDVTLVQRVIALALYQGAFARLTDPDRQAFLSGDGALVYYGSGPVPMRADHDRLGTRRADDPATGQRVGWHVHAFDNGRPVCKWLDDDGEWESALGALGRIVAKHAADVLQEIDAIRLRLVMDVVCPGAEADAAVSGSEGGAAHPIWGPWRDARARQSADDDRHGCSGSPHQ